MPTEGLEWADTTPPTEADDRSLVLFDSGDEVEVQAGDDGIRFLLVSGKPLQEPVAWYGPIVMNTQEQLQQAYRGIAERDVFRKCQGRVQTLGEAYPRTGLICRFTKAFHCAGVHDQHNPQQTIISRNRSILDFFLPLRILPDLPARWND